MDATETETEKAPTLDLNPLDWFQTIGATIMGFCAAAGRLAMFAGLGLWHCFTPPFFPRLLKRQLIEIGYYSLPVVGLTTLFTGMVLALQSYTGFSRFSAQSAVATVVILSITRELSPVLAGLMVAGRVGASIAAEIGTMRVTEQIDALSTLSTNPYKYLIAPRMIAGTLMLPVLVLIGDIIGVFGGYLVSVYSLGFEPQGYLHNTWEYLQADDVVSGLWKAAAFGFIVTLMGCYNGFNSKRGAQGVGAATTNAVVSASIIILISNYILTQVFFGGREMTATAKVELQGVYKSFGSNAVLRGIDISIEKGKSLVVIGGSGTGKSVMIKCVLGLINPDKGSIKVDGQETAGLKGSTRDEQMKKFGMLFQGGALFDSLPVWENVAFGLMQGKKMDRKEAKDIAIEKLRSVGLPSRVAPLYPAELSGGMQKRVALARAVATSPEVIFFDEPTTGLDPIMADVINDLIVEASKGLGATTLSITHDMASARKIADNIAMIYKGQIIWHGSAKDIDHTGNEYVDQFIKGSATGPIQMEL